jgi:hypothetical protein
MMEEIWKDIDFTNGEYQVSNLGRVKSMERLRVMKDGRKRIFPSIMLKPRHNNPYYAISIYSKNYEIHRLVAKAFIPNIDNKRCVNHKDCNKLNNCIDNLEWVTHSENIQHALQNDRIPRFFGIKNKNARAIIQYDKNGCFIKEWGCMSDVKRELGVDLSNLIKHMNKDPKFHSVKGYVFNYK